MSKQYAVPFVNFSGRAREALGSARLQRPRPRGPGFCQKVFGGELRLHAGSASTTSPSSRPPDRSTRRPTKLRGIRIGVGVSHGDSEGP